MGIALRKSESDELMIPDPTKSVPGISKRRVLSLVERNWILTRAGHHISMVENELWGVSKSTRINSLYSLRVRSFELNAKWGDIFISTCYW
jgi:hypothetical protein